jgi:hypothetical protein
MEAELRWFQAWETGCLVVCGNDNAEINGTQIGERWKLESLRNFGERYVFSEGRVVIGGGGRKTRAR